MTFRVRRGQNQPSASFAAYMDLTKEEVEIAEQLAESEGESLRKWVRRIASTAVKEQIATSRETK